MLSGMPSVRRPIRQVGLTLVGLVTAIGGLAGCQGDTPTAAPPAATATPLADLATETIGVDRAAFCSRVAPAAVRAALGGRDTSSDSYANGERAALADGVTDVAHEFGCTWTAADGTEARAWVFAPPVTVTQAGALRTAAIHAPGCSSVPGAPAFGDPSVAVRCHGTGGTASAAYHGLFGDAWLSCSVASPTGGATLADRASAWCATVIQAAAS